MPSSSAALESALPPYTASASPADFEMKLLRDMPVPAGIGMPGSISGSPLPAAAARRKLSETLQS